MAYYYYYIVVIIYLVSCLSSSSLVVEGTKSRSFHSTRRRSSIALFTSSTWKKKKQSSASASTSSAFIQQHGTSYSTIGSSSRRLTFLSKKFVYHQSLHHHDHHRAQHNRFHSTPLFAASNNDDEEECSIKQIYERVQMDDTEWYEQTFSKLLSLDDGDEQNNDITALIDASCAASSSVGEDGYSNTKEKVMQNNEVIDDAEKVDSNLKEEKEADDSSFVGEADNLNQDLVTTAKPKAQPEESQQLPPQQQIVNENVVEDVDNSRSKVKSMNEGGENKQTQQIRQDRGGDYEQEYNYEDYEYDDGRDYNEVEEDEVDYETQQSQKINQGQAMKKTKPIPQESSTSSTTSVNNNVQPSSISIVRLRNTFTNEIINLSSISTLLNLGYTKKELEVLKPKVLELILEDDIQRPVKGLPKRWVRLNKVQGYDDDEVLDEYEEDVDYGWEVEIVSRNSSLAKKEKKEMEVLSNKVDFEQQLAETTMEPKQLSKEASDVEEDADGRVKSAPKTTLQQSTQKSASRPKSQEVSTAQVRSESATIDRDDGATQSKAPKRETIVDSRREQSQQQLKKRKPILDAEEDVPYSRRRDDESNKDEYSREQQRSPKQQRKQREYDDDTSYTTARTPSPRQQQRQRRERKRPQRQQQRNLYIDRGNYDDDEEPPPNKFWMDLPTFRDFLRKEAQLRLNILGPDWKESVLDESRWRYDLYKTWLTMLDEGVGEDLLDEYVDRQQPRRETRRRRRPPTPTKAQSRQSIGRDDEREYDRRPPRPQRRQPRNDLNDNYDDDDNDENYDRPVRRKARTEPQRDDRQRSSRSEPRSKDRRRPPPPPRKKSRNTRWRNFNDLEQILVESSQNRSTERRDYPSQSRRRNAVPLMDEEYDDDDDYDDDDYNDEEDEDDYYGSVARELPRKGNRNARSDRNDEALQEEEDAATLSRSRRDHDK